MCGKTATTSTQSALWIFTPARAGWLGQTPMRSWRAAVNIWEGNRKADQLAEARLRSGHSRADWPGIRFAVANGGAQKGKGRPNPFEEADL